MAGSVEADLSMGHCFEQSRLSARRSSVQLVRQNQLMKKRAGAKLEGRAGRVEYLSAQYVGGKQVRSELDPSERKIARNGHRLGKRGFADPGDVLEEQVSACDQAGHRQSSGLFLPHHDPGEALPKPIQHFGRSLEVKRLLQVPYRVTHFGEVADESNSKLRASIAPANGVSHGSKPTSHPVRKNLSTEGRFFAHRVATRAAASWRSLWNWRTTRAG